MQQKSTTQEERLDALYRISMRLGSTLDLKEILNLVIDSVIQLVGAERGFVVLVDEWGRLRTMTARGVDTEDISQDEVPVSRTIVQRVVATGEPILTSNAQDDARFADRASVIGFQFRSIMCAPLRARGRVSGAIFVDNRMLSGVFNDDDLDLLSTFASQAAMAIDNARLFQQTDQALTNRVEELALFQRIDRELHKSLDLELTLDLVLDWVIRLTQAEVGAVGVLKLDEEKDSDQIRMLVRTDEPETAAIEYLLPLAHSAVTQVRTSKEALQLYQVAADQSIFGGEVQAQLVVPIVIDKQVIGVTFLETNRVSKFLEGDIDVAKRLADRAAVAIGNARLYQQLQDSIEQRYKFTSLMTHELRLPLTSIKGYGDLLAKEKGGSLTEKQASFVETIRRNADRMNDLIDTIGDINRLESNRYSFEIEQYDCHKLVEETVDLYRQKILEKGQTIEIENAEDRLVAIGDPRAVSRILINLLENAHHYTEGNGSIVMRNMSHRAEGHIYIKYEVSDTGIGMSEDDQTRIFYQFYRGSDPVVRDQPGWGLGLTLAKSLAEALGGSIQVTSELNKGTTMTLLVPRDAKLRV